MDLAVEPNVKKLIDELAEVMVNMVETTNKTNEDKHDLEVLKELVAKKLENIKRANNIKELEETLKLLTSEKEIVAQRIKDLNSNLNVLRETYPELSEENSDNYEILSSLYREMYKIVLEYRERVEVLQKKKNDLT